MKEFAQNIIKAGSQIGFNIAKPQLLELRDDRKSTFIDTIKKNLAQTTQFVALILPTAQGDRYDGIKQTCWYVNHPCCCYHFVYMMVYYLTKVNNCDRKMHSDADLSFNLSALAIANFDSAWNCPSLHNAFW